MEGYDPTPTHHFIRLLQDQGLLQYNMTQNIDNLEEKAGINPDILIQAHGSIKGAGCSKCKKEMDSAVLKQCISEGVIYKCTSCEGPVKPNITFFGEALPENFFDGLTAASKCDLMIIMGTALAVQPFNSLVDSAPISAHQVLINRENTASRGYDFENVKGRLFLQGNCDDVV